MTESLMKLFSLTLLISVLCLCSWVQIGVAQPNEDLRLVSPIGAIGRSAVLPGWGQFYAHNRFLGATPFWEPSGLLIGALITHQSFRDVYNNEYVPVALKIRNLRKRFFNTIERINSISYNSFSSSQQREYGRIA